MNLCAAKMLGKARSLLINSRFDSHLEVDSRFVFKKFLEEVFQSKSNIICDVILSNSGDNTMHLHLTGIISETHEQCHVTATDITELKLVGSALSQNEERLRLALKATNDVVWDWDILNDTQRWNEAGTKVFGWTEIVKNTVSAAWWIERVHPDDRQRVEKGFYAVVKNNTVEKWQDEYRFRKADGSYAEVLDRGYILRNDQGSAIRMIGAMLDITEQKNTGKELRESEARFRNLMEGIDSIAVQIGRAHV